MAVRTLGVEEEFLLVDPGTGQPRAVGQAVLATRAEGELTGELQQEQVDTATKPCRTLDELSRLGDELAASPMTVEGSQGQPRPSPLLGEVRAHRALLAKLVGSLRLPTEGSGASVSDVMRDVASQRWHQKGGRRGA